MGSGGDAAWDEEREGVLLCGDEGRTSDGGGIPQPPQSPRCARDQDEIVVEAYFRRIELASYHTGIGMLGRRVPLNYPFGCRPQDAPFRPIADYPYNTWSKVCGREEAVRELAVTGSVPDIFDHVIDVVQVTEGVGGESGPWWSWFWRGERHWVSMGHAAPALG